ncbi:hypothetical protein [Xenorhabdus kozodoii]|uniref:Uncharacterized protein n=1 Tax=Xenorhabdus kozodoii TaxID=351676 RepID=A0A2D0L6R1_9GAMM|nr:hypothetical protein [Xenorhabdus kozodoii]PHM71364.1 hypothetical protein Xkoz_02761 [Xenorhabdus kozodoii]
MHLLTQVLCFSFISLASSPSLAKTSISDESMQQMRERKVNSVAADVPPLTKFSTPDKIMQQVRERGVNSVVAEINAEYGQEKIIQNIKTGDKQWLQIAFKLYPNTHPKFSQQIIDALSDVLIEHPVEILALTKAHRTLSFPDICNIPSTIKGLNQQRNFAKKMVTSLRAAEKYNRGENLDNIETCLWEFERMHSAYL